MKAVRAAAIAILGSVLVGAAPAPPHRVAVLAFMPQPVGMNDEILADSTQVNALENAFIQGLKARGIQAIPVKVRCDADDEACYRNAARSVHADAAVSGAVIRYMALLWNVDISIYGGRRQEWGVLHNEYKGDYDSLLHAMPEVAASVKRTL